MCVGNAQRSLHDGDEVRWCPELEKYLVWDGQRLEGGRCGPGEGAPNRKHPWRSESRRSKANSESATKFAAVAGVRHEITRAARGPTAPDESAPPKWIRTVPANFQTAM